MPSAFAAKKRRKGRKEEAEFSQAFRERERKLDARRRTGAWQQVSEQRRDFRFCAAKNSSEMECPKDGYFGNVESRQHEPAVL